MQAQARVVQCIQYLFASWQAEGNLVKQNAVMSLALCTYLLVGIGGCGTIMHGNKQTLHISSGPPGAVVLYDGVIRGVTPCDVSVSRRPLKIDLVLWKSGYRAKKLEIWNRISLWALLGNVAVGGIPGWVFDAATGSFGAYYTDTYHVDFLAPDAANEVAADSGSGNANDVRQSQLDKRTASKEAWGRLRVGMPGAQARQILGEPQDTSRTPKSVIWFYAGIGGREGHIALLNGEVHSWREPGNIAREKGA